MIDFEYVARGIDVLSASLGSTILICIDGRAGSGKTTCALGLKAHLPHAEIIHMDDLYEGWTNALDRRLSDRIETQIIEPLMNDQNVRYQRFDWNSNSFAQWVEVPKTRLLILEGVGSAQLSVRKHAALTIWISIDAATGAQRVLARDGDISAGNIAQWQIQEDEHFEINQTPLMCDLTFSGV